MKQRDGRLVGSTAEFLNLSPEEAALALSKALQDLRKSKNLTQIDLAKRIKSSQSRVAKMEAADNSVAIDLMSLLHLPAQQQQHTTCPNTVGIVRPRKPPIPIAIGTKAHQHVSLPQPVVKGEIEF